MQLNEMEGISHSSDSSQFFAVIIANPTSGNGGFPLQNRHFDETLTFLRNQGWKAELWYTQSAGDGEQLARKAVKHQVNLVIAAGGDGTINEIIQGLAGSETALGVLPSGTVNVWARELGIPLDDTRARNILVHGQTRRIDLGCVNGRYFLLMVGIGFDGEVTQAVEGKPLKRLGVLGILPALDDGDAFHLRDGAILWIDHLDRCAVRRPLIAGIFEAHAEREFAAADTLTSIMGAATITVGPGRNSAGARRRF